MDKNQITIADGIPEFGIIAKENDAWVSSNFLAEYFEKRHDHTLEEIKKISENLTPDFWGANFKKSTYISRGKKYPCYLLNRKAFTLIAMGFTGSKALNFKVKYIEAFEAMVSTINTRAISKEGYKIMTSAICRMNPSANQYDYKNEAEMINMIVLGMTSKNFKELNNIDEATRDSATTEKLQQLDEAQRLNAKLIIAGISFENRKQIIIKTT